MRPAFCLGLLLTVQFPAQAQEAIRAAYQQLYQGDANGAYQQFRAIADRDSQSLAASFGVLVALYERGLEDAPFQKEFEQSIDRLIQSASDRYEKNKRDTDALFYLVQGHLNRARYRAEFDKGMWGAARDGVKAKKYGDEYIKLDPGRADGYLAVGLYNNARYGLLTPYTARPVYSYRSASIGFSSAAFRAG